LKPFDTYLPPKFVIFLNYSRFSPAAGGDFAGLPVVLNAAHLLSLSGEWVPAAIRNSPQQRIDRALPHWL